MRMYRIAVVTVALAAGCTLNQGLKIQCNQPADCNAGKVCSGHVCATPQTIAECQNNCGSAEQTCGTSAPDCVSQCVAQRAAGQTCTLDVSDCAQIVCASAGGAPPGSQDMGLVGPDLTCGNPAAAYPRLHSGDPGPLAPASCSQTRGPVHPIGSDTELTTLLDGRWLGCTLAFGPGDQVGIEFIGTTVYFLVDDGHGQAVRGLGQDHTGTYRIVSQGTPGEYGIEFDDINPDCGIFDLRRPVFEDSPRKLWLGSGTLSSGVGNVSGVFVPTP